MTLQEAKEPASPSTPVDDNVIIVVCRIYVIVECLFYLLLFVVGGHNTCDMYRSAKFSSQYQLESNKVGHENISGAR